MRLLHPTTLKIASERNDIPKTVISHAWSEVFKFVASNKFHPKMFLPSNLLGRYLAVVYHYGTIKGCNLNINKVLNIPLLKYGFNTEIEDNLNHLDPFFDKDYLFSDACSLYFKGINIFPDIYKNEWRKYVPIESYKEILRQINKHTNTYVVSVFDSISPLHYTIKTDSKTEIGAIKKTFRELNIEYHGDYSPEDLYSKNLSVSILKI